jgi:alpha-tubulin suppressor-like RCC1 family protein
LSTNSCIFVTDDNKIMVWGENKSLVLGVTGKLPSELVLPPTPRSPHPEIVNLSVGAHHALAITKDGFVFGWGSNKYGQLGLGFQPTVHPEPPTLLKELPVDSSEIKQVFVGATHSAFLTKSGQVYAFGNNEFCQLALGPSIWAMKSVPNLVSFSPSSFPSSLIPRPLYLIYPLVVVLFFQ